MLSDPDRLARAKADTMPPFSATRGEVLVVSADAAFRRRALEALSDDGWRTTPATPADLVSGALLTSDVILVDPLGQRRRIERTIDSFARIRLRPAMILALRRADDLALAVRRCIGCVDVAVSPEILQDAVLRAHRAHRVPRGR
jgi:hypothetical protein